MNALKTPALAPMAGTSQPGRASGPPGVAPRRAPNAGADAPEPAIHPPGPAPRPAVWHLALIAALAFGLYAATIGFGFVWDDDELVMANPFITRLANLPVLFQSHPFAGVERPWAKGLDVEYYRPVWTTTLALDHALWGLRPHGYHLTNVLLHVAVSLIAYLVALAILRHGLAALFAALLFAAHPVHAEAVAWVSARNEPLAALFTLLAFAGYVRYRESASAHAPARIGWLAATVAAYWAGLLSKETAIVLPLLVLLEEWRWARGSMRAGGTSVRARLVGPLLFALATVPYLMLRAAMVAVVHRPGDPALPERLFNAPRVVLEYLRLLVLPWNLKVFYVLPVEHSAASPAVLSALLLLALVMAGLLWLGRRDRSLAFGLAWALLALLPVSGILAVIRPAAVADRYAYLPSFGICLAAGALLARGAVSRRARTAPYGTAALAVAILAFSVMTVTRLGAWRDDLALMTRMVADAPGEAMGYRNRGVREMERGLLEPARRDLELAARLAPGDTRVLLTLAEVHVRQGRPDLARAPLAGVLRIDSTSVEAHLALGRLEYQAGRHDEAVRAFGAALAREPRNAEAHVGLGAIWRAQERLADAEREYRAALDSDPRNAAAHQNLGNLHASQGRMDEAAREFARAVELAPREAAPHYNFAMLLEALGKVREAEAEYRTAAALDSSMAQAHYSLGALLWKQGRTREALEEMRTAVRLAPGVPVYRQMLEAVERGGKR